MEWETPLRFPLHFCTERAFFHKAGEGIDKVKKIRCSKIRTYILILERGRMSCVGILEDIFSAAFWGDEAPKVPDWEEWIHIPMGLTHCETCLKLDRCWFVEENRPILPQHPRCHCTSVPLPFSRVLKEATSGCMLSKIDPYLFDPKGNINIRKEKCLKAGDIVLRMWDGCKRSLKNRRWKNMWRESILWENWINKGSE